MRKIFALFVITTSLVHAQDRAGRAAVATTPSAAATPPNAADVGRDYVRENYTKFEYRIAMRDGVKLFTSVYIPKDVFPDNRTYPILMQRTAYGIPPYGLE